jgi:hypothetical protein
MWITSLAVSKNGESYAQRERVIHISGQFIHAPPLFPEDFSSSRYPQGVEMWISYPQIVWISEKFTCVDL